MWGGGGVIASGHVTLFSTQLWISQQPQAVNPARTRPCLGVTPQRHGDRLLSSAAAVCQEQYLVRLYYCVRSTCTCAGVNICHILWKAPHAECYTLISVLLLSLLSLYHLRDLFLNARGA
jgi:hypothetical protein